MDLMYALSFYRNMCEEGWGKPKDNFERGEDEANYDEQ